MAAFKDSVVPPMTFDPPGVLIALYAFSYFLGAVPFGYLVGKAKGVDITKVGSGNIGATNTYRALGKSAGLTVFALDVAKGVVPPLVTAWLFRTMPIGFVMGDPGEPYFLPGDQVLQHQVTVSLLAVLGHSFSPFLKFKGGKGVATGLGTILGIAPLVGLAGFGVFVLVLWALRIVSVASILGSLTVVLTAVLTHQPPLICWVYGLVVTLVIVRHVPNIRRFFRGEEPRFEFKKKKPGDSGKSDDSNGEGHEL